MLLIPSQSNLTPYTIEIAIVPIQTRRIPIACIEENFSLRKIIPNMIAITGLIEERGVARDASINSIAAKNATPPKPQLRIPVRPKMKISLF
jgi:hypothetical protein